MKRARNAWDLSLRDAADRIGIQQETLASYENATSEPSLKIAARICKAYGIEDFVSFVLDTEFLLTPGSEDYLSGSFLEKKYRKIPERIREAVNILLNIPN